MALGGRDLYGRGVPAACEDQVEVLPYLHVVGPILRVICNAVDLHSSLVTNGAGGQNTGRVRGLAQSVAHVDSLDVPERVPGKVGAIRIEFT